MSQSASRQGILSLSIKDKNALYAAYMLFIPTKREYEMGEEVFLLLNLMEETERLPIAGKIIWITPVGAEPYRTQGVGVQFSEQEGGVARHKIEAYLDGALESDPPTHTL